MLSISEIFIKKPVLTTVCTIIIVLVGLISLPLLPLAKLPDLAPKQVSVTANYVGSDAKTAEDNVTTVLERQINGTEQVIYMNSYTDNTGTSTINVYFPVEMDRNIAQVLVQNNVAIAQSSLPEEVNRQGVTTQKQSPSVTIAYGFYSEKDAEGKFIYDDIFISNFIDRVVSAEIERLDGVGSSVSVGVGIYAMRFWLDPDALAARGLSSGDVVDAIRSQNIQVGAGGINLPPIEPEQRFQISARAVGRFVTPEEAAEIVVKVGDDGTLIKVKDVGYVTVGAQNYRQVSVFDGAPAVAFIVYQLPGTNALNTADLVKQKMAELEPLFPPGLKAAVALDNTLFVTASLKEAFLTLIEAILQVFLVIFIFLQNWRTTIIPALAIPVSLIGAMAFALAFGFSLNQLTLFGVVLATGLVVDDGILVVEAVETKLFQGMRPLQAALDAMGELSGAGGEQAPSSLEAAIRQEIKEGSFLDWSRLKLRAGDVNRELAGAYRLMLAKIAQVREEQAYNFACLLQRAASFNHFEAGILLIEDVLEKIVVPIAKTQPALILLFDGMSLAAARELLTALVSQGQWTLKPNSYGEAGVGAALGALPSITEVCRASLLSGQLECGDASLEKKRFSRHPLLLPLCRAKYPPRLFHKNALNPQDGSATAEVCDHITDAAHKIVAVVINAIDDALLKSDQLEFDWTLASVKPLAALLHSARLAQREVIVLSDHGHVLEFNTESHAGEDGERWRRVQGSPRESELLMTGARVLRPESKTLIAPWSESLRYGVRKNGYHGGVNPQEMLAPVFILSPAGPSARPKETLLEEPEWWSADLESIGRSPKRELDGFQKR